MKSIDFQRLRVRMVEEQIVARGIRNPATLESMREVPRHLFVPEELRFASYDDTPLPIEACRPISDSCWGNTSEVDPLSQDSGR